MEAEKLISILCSVISCFFFNPAEVMLRPKEEQRQEVKREYTKTTIEKGSTVMLVGDSLAVGLGSHFHSILKKENYKTISYSKSGTTTAHWSRRIEGLLKTHSPKLVLVSLGTNDSYDVGKSQPTEDMYRRMSETITKSGAVLVWIGPPDIKRNKIVKIDDIRTMITNTIPLYFHSEKERIPLIDGIHTTGLGYYSWMKSINQWMIDEKIIEAPGEKLI